jgi:hypothetical protein
MRVNFTTADDGRGIVETCRALQVLYILVKLILNCCVDGSFIDIKSNTL